MALGGGTFLTQSKILPGAYINFVSMSKATNQLARGVATIPLDLSWGPEGEMFTVRHDQFMKDGQVIFGYDYADKSMRLVREIFQHAQTVHFFRLNSGGVKATNKYCTARYSGTRGNDLKTVIEQNEDGETFDVSTFLGTFKVDEQKGAATTDDLDPNDWVTWGSTVSLELTAGVPLTSGTNGTVGNPAYQTYLDQAEAYSFNAMGCPSTDSSIIKLFAANTKRMRDEVGKKYQLVCFRGQDANHEGVVSVKNTIKGQEADPSLVYWVTGVIAGTPVNRSATNMTYDGELDVDTRYTQAQLEDGIREGSFMLHAVNGKATVLEDLNTFTNFTLEKSDDFASNQTIRVLDQIGNDVASLFAQKYMGKIPNKPSGRVSLWADIVKHHEELQLIQAIEDFDPEKVTVEPGEGKKAVAITDVVKPVSAMSQLYMTVYVQ